MKKKGFNFRFEVQNVKDDDEFNNNSQLIAEIQQLFNETPFPLDGAGFAEGEEFLMVFGQVYRDTMKEAKAEYTLFKAKLKRLFEKYYKKVKLNDLFLAYFTLN